MLPDAVRDYLLGGLEATPVVLDRLLEQATDADFDRRPDEERFTIREAVAHLADWEAIWQARLEKIQAQDDPTLPNHDPDEYAAQHGYAQADVRDRQARFREQRAVFVKMLRHLAPEEWDRAGYHTRWGKMTVEAMVTLVLGHDAYHLRQVSEWLGR